MKTIVEVDNKQYVRDVIVYNSETQEPLVVTDSTPLLYLQRRGFRNVRTKDIPETWEEFNELCKELKSEDVYICERNENVQIVGSVMFTKCGTIEYDMDHIIAENRTPAQMWQIIKNLIGEE